MILQIRKSLVALSVTCTIGVGAVAGSATVVYAQSTAASAAQALQLVANDQDILRFPQVPQRIAIADDTVAQVHLLTPVAGQGGEVLVVGKRPGKTDLRVWLPGRQSAQRWTITVTSQIEEKLKHNGRMVHADVSTAGSQALLTGESETLLDHQAALAAAQESGDTSVLDLSQISTSGMVQVEVKVVEVSREVMKDIGLDVSAMHGSRWTGASNLLPRAISGGLNVMYRSRDFNATLNLLEQNGLARVLAEPTLVAMSGHSASFLSGGEIPIPVSGGLGTTTVEYKPFGIGLTVSPTVLSPDRIALKVAPEASELDFSTVVGLGEGAVMPAIRTRRADTTVELGDGESYIISGLVSRQTSAAVKKIPFLGDLPILGSFFRNVQYSQKELELVIAVTPRLIKPIQQGVALKFPGERQEKVDDAPNAWGYFLMGRHGYEQMPGFSR
ncbi:type II and III secretion system protein family protein [Alcaligenes endophyticus]|uniref:Pilus assembly protein N-terminal domain-containing protein n=1 Tax=Alcaligenes endophyticus TaxID=1929088 RepID=A0ABT8EHC4_9BURK|nr:pilus assembly protein N-terminal domain-containing protein [Alcaligenes endophyticus]MCX5592049.1 pilus assembly protein N-terminal domain-containing protein [Alcaligenes endophyticus]MDN4120696.1 pilus assembly protein N-terminal domain-containing protein [Alcaligenes endophyticus]